jgi:hypothetical protein
VARASSFSSELPGICRMVSVMSSPDGGVVLGTPWVVPGGLSCG